MKKVIGWIIIIVLAISSFMIVEEKNEIYNLGNEDDSIEFRVRYKGLKDAVDFIFIDNKMYIAFSKEIKCIENGKEPYSILYDEELDINYMEALGDNLYFISKSKLMSIDINNKTVKEHISDLPNKGDYEEILLKAYKESIYITIGSMTNSGIVGNDNEWIKSYPKGCDLSPSLIKLRENSIGAFTVKGKSNTNGQVIKAEHIGNSSIIVYNTNTLQYETYAWGIRNIKGIDITEDGRVFATVGGYEPRGERPVYNDSDYIYEVKKNNWYGFPDFSGGDSLDSPRFNNGEGKINMILSEYPMNPSAPYYQYNNVDSLKWLAIDNSGLISKNNQSNIFFYNNEKNSIYYGIIGGVFDKFIELNSKCSVSSMKIMNNELYILDSTNGFLFTIELVS